MAPTADDVAPSRAFTIHTLFWWTALVAVTFAIARQEKMLGFLFGTCFALPLGRTILYIDRGKLAKYHLAWRDRVVVFMETLLLAVLVTCLLSLFRP